MRSTPHDLAVTTLPVTAPTISATTLVPISTPTFGLERPRGAVQSIRLLSGQTVAISALPIVPTSADLLAEGRFRAMLGRELHGTEDTDTTTSWLLDALYALIFTGAEERLWTYFIIRSLQDAAILRWERIARAAFGWLLVPQISIYMFFHFYLPILVPLRVRMQMVSRFPPV